MDVLGSVSRVVGKVTTPAQRERAVVLRSVLAARRQADDLIDIGAYKQGANPLVDAAVTHQAAIDAFLTQSIDDLSTTEESWRHLTALTDTFEGRNA